MIFERRLERGLVKRVFDAFTSAQLMGHSDVRTTQRYVRATELNKRAAVQAALLGHNWPQENERQARLLL